MIHHLMALRRSSLIIALGFTLFLAGCSEPADTDGENASKTSATQPVKIGIDVFPGWGHAFIAAEKGMFKKHGANVQLVAKTDYLEVMDDYKNGLVDGAFLVFADVIFLNDQAKPSMVTYVSDHSISGDVLYAVSDISSVKELEGKTIGVEGINSFSHLFVLSVLEKAGMSELDVNFKSINAQEIIQEIEAGHIVAGHTYGPGRDLAEKKGLSPLAKSGDVKGVITDVLAMSADFVSENQQTVQAITAALFEAKTYQINNREEAVAIIAKANKDSVESVSGGIDAVEYLSAAQAHTAMQYAPPGDLHVFGKRIAEFYMENNQITLMPDFSKLIYSKAVNEIAH